MRPQRAPPARFAGLRVEVNDPALAPIVERTFAALRGAPFDTEAVFDAVDRLYGTGFFTGVWPRLDADGTLVIRADAQSPLLLSFSVGYDDDLGPRIFAGLHGRSGATEFALASRLGAVQSWANVSARHPLRALPTLATTAGVEYRNSEIREFDGERVIDETGVRRGGGWAGVVWTGTDDRAEVVAALRADRIDADPGREGAAYGFSLRIAGREPNARVVGTPLVIETERRWGDVAWTVIRARGSVGLDAGRLRTALQADLAAVGTNAPLDANPALGEPDGLPGLRAGSWRAPVRAIAGLDVAWPIPFEGHARIRLRVGGNATRLGDLDRTRWTPGVGLDLLWWSPWGRLALGLGATRHAGWRATIDLGPRF
jgi:hypothetical protein